MQNKYTRNKTANVLYLNASFSIELQVAEHGGFGASERKVRQRHGNGHVDADVAALDFELKFTGSGT
jgi:hypothetical protein